MKRASVCTIIAIACIVFVANAGVTIGDNFPWQNAAGDPLRTPIPQAISTAPIPDWVKKQATEDYLNNRFEVADNAVTVWKGEEREDWMKFGQDDIAFNVVNTWNGVLKSKDNGMVLGTVPPWTSIYQVVYSRSDTLDGYITTTFVRLRIWPWCGNLSGKTWQEARPVPKVVPPEPKKQPERVHPPPPLKVQPPPVVKQPSKLRFAPNLLEISGVKNNQKPIDIGYLEAKWGMGVRYVFNKRYRVELDGWLVMGRLHPYDNGRIYVGQGPIFQLNPKIMFQPWDPIFGMLSYSVSVTGWGRNDMSYLGMLQYNIEPWLIWVSKPNKLLFRPIIQVTGDHVDSWSTYLAWWRNRNNPQPAHVYEEMQLRVNLLDYKGGMVLFGYQARWSHFQMAGMYDFWNNQTLHHDYRDTPNPGGLYATWSMGKNWSLDAVLERYHLEGKSFLSGRWIHAEQDITVFKFVLAHGSRFGIIK